MRKGMVWFLLLAMLLQIALPAAALEGETDPVSPNAEATVEEDAPSTTEEELAVSEDPQTEEEDLTVSEPSGESGVEMAEESEDETALSQETPVSVEPDKNEEEESSSLEEQETLSTEESAEDSDEIETTEELPEEEAERLYNGQEADFNDPDFVRLLESGYFDAADDGIATFSTGAATTYAWGDSHSSRFQGYDVDVGIDVSKWNKANAAGTQAIQWSSVASEVDFVIIRCAYRGLSDGTLYTDESFRENIEGALAAGLDVGIYIFSQALNEQEAREEAQYVLKLAEGYSFTLPIVMDYEYSSGGRLTSNGLSDAQRTRNCLAFCEEIEDAGYRAMLYANRSMLEDDLDGQRIADEGYDIWLAEWTSSATYGGTYTYWQYSDRGSVSGIYGGVDMDYRYRLPEANLERVFCTYSGVRLYWNTVSQADSYRIYRQTSGSAGWTLLSTVSGSGTGVYLDTTAVEGQSYRYRVQSCDGSARADYDPEGTAVTYVPQLSLVAVANEAGGIRLKWETDDSCEGYQLLRKNSGDASWSVLAEIDNPGQTSYLDTTVADVKGGTAYDYTIRGIQNGQPSDQYDEYGLEIVWLPVTELTQAASYSGGMRVIWEPVDGAEGYEVYRKDNGQWVKQASVKGGSTRYYIDSSVADAVTSYTYTVRAYSGSTRGYYDTTGITGLHIPTPELSALTVQSGAVQITWETVPQADAYYVYRKQGTGAWTQIAKVTDTSYRDSLSSFGLYCYTVRAGQGNAKSWYDEDGLSVSFLSTPVLRDTYASDNGITVNWNAVEGADGYRVYRRNGSSWKLLGTASSNTYTDRTADSDQSYTYTVRAYSGDSLSDYDRDGITYFVVGIPDLISVVNNSGNGMTIRWQTVSGASNYAVYRKTSNSNWTRIATTGVADSYNDTTVTSGVRYTYTVRARQGSSWGNYESGLSATYLATPNLREAAYHDNGATVSWDEVPGASGYRVFRRGSSGWVAIGNTTSTSYMDNAATDSGQSYRYTVRAYQGSAWSYYDTTGVTFRRLATPSLTGLSNDWTGMTLTWQKVSGAEQYAVYRKTASTGWKRIATLGDVNSYTDTSGVSGTRYTYTVRALISDSLASGYVTAGRSCVWLSKPSLAKIDSVANGIRVTWGAVDGAQSYRVYRKLSGGSWELIDTVNACLYVDTDQLENGKTYVYTVRAVNGGILSSYDSKGLSFLYLDTPKLSRLTNVSGGLSLTWEKVSGAERYAVYRKTSGTNWTRIATLGDVNSYIDAAAVSGTRYTYTVRAIKNNVVASGYSEAGLSCLRMNQPSLTKIDSVANGIRVTWGAVDGAQSYRVYRKLSGGSWELIDTVNACLYVDTDQLENGKTYVYTVRAVNGGILSSYDSKGLSFLYLDTPKLSRLTNVSGGLSLTWEKVSGAERYAVYRKTSGTNWTRIATLGDVNSYIDAAAVSGTRYTYTVRAIKNNVVASGYSEAGLSCLRMNQPSLTKIDSVANGIRVTWGAVDGAQSYRVYRKLSGGSWELIDTVNACLYVDADQLENGKTYVYTIRAVNGGTLSSYDTSGLSYRYLDTPRLLSAANGTAGVTVRWSAVDGAEKYAVYRRIPGGAWSRIQTTGETTSYVDTTAVSGTQYEYTVRAGVGTYLSGYVAEGIAVHYLSVPVLRSAVEESDGVRVSWDAVSGAQTYRIYRKTTGGWQQMAIISASYTSWLDTSATETGTVYTYTVRASAGGLSGYDSKGLSIER